MVLCMKTAKKRPILAPSLAWLALIAATLVSYFSAGLHEAGRTGLLVVMLIASVKVLLILRCFMEVQLAHAPVRIFFGIWTLACAVMVTALH
jgi:hypothetical protein